MSEFINSSEGIQALIQSHERLKVNSRKEIIFPEPLFKRNREMIILPKEIVLNTGQRGKFKSSLNETFISLLLRKDNLIHSDFLGFETEYKNLYVAYIDTERSEEHRFPAAIQNIKRQAGYNIKEDISNFFFTSIHEIKRQERLETLKQLIKHICLHHKAPGYVFFLDLCSDLIPNFNDLSETYEFIDTLYEYKEKYNVTFFCSIHENPGGTKERGHLGTELGNKASCVLKITYDHQLQQGAIKFDKLSIIMPPNDIIFRRGEHFLEIENNPKRENELFSKLVAFAYPKGDESYRHGELVGKLNSSHLIGSTQGKKYVSKLFGSGLLRKEGVFYFRIPNIETIAPESDL